MLPLARLVGPSTTATVASWNVVNAPPAKPAVEREPLKSSSTIKVRTKLAESHATRVAAALHQRMQHGAAGAPERPPANRSLRAF
jgi:hypothetical protein